MILEGRSPSEVGIDPEQAGAAGEAQRLRQAAHILRALRERVDRGD